MRAKIGDVFEMTLPSGRFAYSQFSLNGPYGTMVRVLPGVFAESLSQEQLAILTSHPEIYQIYSSIPEDLDGRRRVRIVASHPVPEESLTMPMLRKRAPISTDNPHGWGILDSEGAYLTEVEFLREHSQVDVMKLSTANVPSVGKLLGMIDRAEFPGTDRDRRTQDAGSGTSNVKRSEARYFFLFPRFDRAVCAQQQLRAELSNTRLVQLLQEGVSNEGPDAWTLILELPERLTDDELELAERIAIANGGEFSGDDFSIS